tara:strand:+ start:880 stop:2925 length:2046 start_codon:yes stop_codon:yes gene_type:complete
LASIKFTEAQSKKLKKLGIFDEWDLLMHVPSRYIDETEIQPIAKIQPEKLSQIQGTIVKTKISYAPRKNLIAHIKDETGEIQIRFLNFYPSQIKQLEEGALIRVFGEAKVFGLFYEMVHPQYKIIREGEPLPSTYTPVYPVTAGMAQKSLRKLIQKYISIEKTKKQFDDLFPAIYKKNKFPSFIKAIECVHKPPKKYKKDDFDNKRTVYHQRLIYDEFLAQQLFFRSRYLELKKHKAPKFSFSKKIHESFLQQITFNLTGQQKIVFSELKKDFTLGHPMNRMLQGDVGSGKTIVAVMAAVQVMDAGYQVAFMAPTEILAGQHYEKIKDWLTPLSFKVELLSGAVKGNVRKKVYENLEVGKIDLLIGTHAVFQEAVKFKNLGFYIIDEQHRFGVEQRVALRESNLGKLSYEPHKLMMSATPIPRTLSMSYFADMEISIINELPPGRIPIITKLFSEERRMMILDNIKKLCLQGSQAYWVCPLIEDSETLQLQTAIETYNSLSKILLNLDVGLIHGRMKSDEKKEIMQKFQDNQINILVATTVIEVGVDVPNATLMVIENAERLGLSQLHQLRGRIGRGGKESACILLYKKQLSDTSKKRLKIIFESSDGFIIAEEDLKLRGPGEFLGLKQSGLPSLKIGNLSRDESLLNIAKKDAEILLKNEHKSFLHLDRWLKNYKLLSRA